MYKKLIPMFVIETNIESALVDCPLIREWIDIIKTSILKNDIQDSDIQAYYSYGFFVSKSKNTQDGFERMMDSSLKMKYDERLEFEKSKVRVDVTMKMGNLVIANRLPKGTVPTEITEIVTEIVKVKMTIESEMYNTDQDVVDSVPPLSGKISIDIIRDNLDMDTEFDMDDILDKISHSGIESLTPDEKEFLDKKSKDF